MKRYLLYPCVLLSMLLYTVLINAAEIADLDYHKDMQAAKHALKHHHGGGTNLALIIERFEYQTNEDEPLFTWFAQGWWGADINKLLVKTEGEYDDDASHLEEAEIQILYSRAVTPFWDLQAGIRYDIQPKPTRTFMAFGFQGTAPYWLEVDATGFVSDQGDLSVRLEGEYELNITQSLILQPRVELNLSFAEDLAIGVDSGLNTSEVACRLHYALSQTLAPYIGINWAKSFGGTADLRREDGEDIEALSFVGGIKFLF